MTKLKTITQELVMVLQMLLTGVTLRGLPLCMFRHLR